MSKLKLAAYWGAGCGGCDTAILDLNEKVLDLAEAADLVFWPIAVDTKYLDVESMPDEEIDVTLYHGAVRNSENQEMAALLRRKSKAMVAFGSCAHLGGVPGLANLFDREQIFQRVYHTSPSTTGNGVEPATLTQVPEGELTLPEFYDTVLPLDRVVAVEYYVPGCPPPPHQIWAVLEAVISGNLPPPGSVVGAGDKSQCDECPRTRDEVKITEVRRLATSQPEPDRCLLEQGFLCMGPATRAGCGSRCQSSGVACRGCFGPLPEVPDQGARALSAVASILDSNDADRIQALVEQIPDPVRTFHRFTLPSSLMRRRVP